MAARGKAAPLARSKRGDGPPLRQETIRIVPGRDVFISYSHLDSDWLETIKQYLEPFVGDDALEIWDDRFGPGARPLSLPVLACLCRNLRKLRIHRIRRQSEHPSKSLGFKFKS